MNFNSTNQPNQHTNQPSNQLPNQTTNEANQPANQSIYQPTNWRHEPTNQLTNHLTLTISINQRTNKRQPNKPSNWRPSQPTNSYQPTADH